MKKAFTLIEILVVITVLLILVSIAVPRLRGYQDEANKTKVKSELKSLKSAVESYWNSTGGYPPTTETIAESYLLGATPQMLNRTLYDPFSPDGTNEYKYFLSDNGQYYALLSVGPDGALSTTTVSDSGVVVPHGDDIVDGNAEQGEAPEAGSVENDGTCTENVDCESGACVSGACVDLLTDANNCGAPGNACCDIPVCSDGVCAQWSVKQPSANQYCRPACWWTPLCRDVSPHLDQFGVVLAENEMVEVIDVVCFYEATWGNDYVCPPNSEYRVCIRNGNDGSGGAIWFGVRTRPDACM
ncbi:MAG: prepilin-type N-terminal cleavage/methylation domain-containing protein [Elusimicrobia bacterium]|nr:prepilin-type N-terminal cleavage/methylation domain-containing protein [Elusimicrobiota bacterium]